MINKVKACSSIYNIQYLDGLKDGNDNLFGEIEYGFLTIKINKKYHLDRQRQAILHEAIHAINYEYQFNFKEIMIERLSNAFYAFLIDNKKFINEIIN